MSRLSPEHRHVWEPHCKSRWCPWVKCSCGVVKRASEVK